MAGGVIAWCHLGYGSIPQCAHVEPDTRQTQRHYRSVLKVIKDNSSDETKTSVTKLTTTNRDVWRNNREDLRRISGANRTYLRDIETAILHMCLTNKNGGNDPQH
uniref:Carn_acyltransf domain-containing protein n=1 Tax=Caenorhabditis japonica TaxID=281687 RepID=A0A8R1EWG3_CAEJA